LGTREWITKLDWVNENSVRVQNAPHSFRHEKIPYYHLQNIILIITVR
jgi:hypothetical protein